MGAASSRVNQSLGWGGVPDKKRSTYFKEQLMLGWYEVLCCPSAMGSIITRFIAEDASGGEAEYKVKLRLSHSEHVPRYQLHVVKGGKTRQWIVGHMEKTETHLRAKPGEFIRVQVWKITCNMWVWEKRRSALHRKSHLCYSAVKERPTPTADNMEQMGMTIALQAKCDPTSKDKKERWVQTIGTDKKTYKLSVEPPPSDKYHKEQEAMNVLRILYQGNKVCVARKQRFAGTLGKVCQPYLGVQIKPSDLGKSRDAQEENERFGPSWLKTNELMLLLMCLAWSEETMSPTSDRTQNFINAMRAKSGEQDSADWQGLSVQWNTDDVRERLKHVPYAAIHSWNEEARPADEEEDEDDDPEAFMDAREESPEPLQDWQLQRSSPSTAGSEQKSAQRGAPPPLPPPADPPEEEAADSGAGVGALTDGAGVVDSIV